MPPPKPHGSITKATIRACAADQDRWPARVFVSLPVPPPTGHILDQTAVPIAVEAVAPKMDSARSSRLQSADRLAALQPDNRSRNIPDHRPHCTELQAVGLHDRSIRSWNGMR